MKLLLILLLIPIMTVLSAQVDEQFLAADQSLMVMPTAYTMPMGKSALTSFELVLLQYSYAVSNRAHLSAGMVFPFTTDMLKTFTLGAKVNYYRGADVQTALWASYTPDPNTATLGHVISVGNPKVSGHFIAALAGNLSENEAQSIFGLGGIVSLSERVSGIGEVYYLPGKLISFNDEIDSDSSRDWRGILLGIRFKGEWMSWDLGGMRPLSDWGDDLLALPFIKATFMF